MVQLGERLVVAAERRERTGKAGAKTTVVGMLGHELPVRGFGLGVALRLEEHGRHVAISLR